MLPGGALEQALWLHDAPARRDAVRAAPLPADIESALRVAGGAPTAVAEAAAATGADPGTVLEAVRFYLQQVLFGEGADAYRVLGVERTADLARIRRHHKLLQAWLHPDRNADAWNDVFATRVNQAWMALRSDSARARYDAAPAPGADAAAPVPPRPMVVAHHWEPLEAPGGRSRARWLAIGGFASCVVLLGLLLFREPPAPATVQREPLATAGATEEGSAPLPATVALAPADVPPAAEEAPLTAAPQQVEHAPPVPAVTAPIPASPVRTRPEPAPVIVADTAPPPAAPAPRRSAPSPRPQPPRIVEVPQPAPATPETNPPVVAAPVATTALAAPAAPAAPTRPPVDPYQRMQEAQASLRTTLAFLSDPGNAPPLWNDVGIAERGARIRAALHDRGDVHRVALSGSHWVLRDDEAIFGASYATGGRRGERGRLDLQLVRREGHWLVADLRLEPAG